MRLQAVADELEAVNTRFNNELQQQIDNGTVEGHVYKLGMPGEALLSNLENYPLEMAASTLETNPNRTVNSIISLYPKQSSVHVAKWFLGSKSKENGRDILKWSDTKKALNWLSNNASYVHSVGLSTKSIAKIIQNHLNPTISTKKMPHVGRKIQ